MAGEHETWERAGVEGAGSGRGGIGRGGSWSGGIGRGSGWSGGAGCGRCGASTGAGAFGRRAFLKASLATGALLALGGRQRATAQGDARDLIVVSDGGDGTGASATVIDPVALEVLGTFPMAGGFSFPATRWAFGRDLIWSGLPGGPTDAVRAFDLATGEQVVEVPTGSSQNYTELTPDGSRLLVAARFADAFHVLAADPADAAFGQEIARLETYEGADPCDVTIHPAGEYAYAPDRGGDTLTVLRLEPLERVASLPMAGPPSVPAGTPLEPYMATVSPTGDTLLVENAVVSGGSPTGSEALFDLADPARPVEVARFGPQDGLGRNPLTSEIAPNGRWGMVLCRDDSEVAVVDLARREIAARVALPDGSNPFTGTFAFGAGDPSGTFFVPLPGRDAVAAISIPGFEVRATIPVGARPQGIVYLRAALPSRAATAHPLGEALRVARTLPDICPDPCCGPV